MSEVTVLLVGDRCSEKTYFRIHWETGNPPGEHHVPDLLAEPKERILKVGRQELSIELCNLVSDPDCAYMRGVLYRDTTIFLLFFSCDSVESLAHISSMWVPEITENAGLPLVLMLVGVGSKLVHEDYEQLEARGESPFGDCPVTREMVEKVMEDIGADACMYYSTCMPDRPDRVVYKAAEIYVEKLNEAKTKKREEKTEKKKRSVAKKCNDQEKKHSEKVKILLLGDGCTQTPEFARQWHAELTQGDSGSPLDANPFWPREASVKVGGQELVLALCPTPGEMTKEDRGIRSLCYTLTDVVILFFSYEYDTCIEGISSRWMPEITENIGRPFVLLLIGIGFKLASDYELLEAMGKCPFADCSVDDEMVQKVIAEIEPDDFMYCCPTMNGSFKMVVDRVAEIYLEKIKQQETEAKNKEEEKGEKKKHKRRWWQRKDKGKK